MLPFLIASGLISAVGTGIQAYNNAKANDIANRNYEKQRQLLLSDKYANPLDNASNMALLSKLERRMNKTEEAIENQAASGGATVENVLAAKQNSNDVMADVVSNIVQGSQARKDSISQQLLNLDSQRTAQQMAAKQASGQMWSNLAGNVAGAVTTYGGVKMEEDMFEKLLKAV